MRPPAELRAKEMRADQRIAIQQQAQLADKDQQTLIEFESAFPGMTVRQVQDTIRDLRKTIEVLTGPAPVCVKQGPQHFQPASET